MTGTSDIAGLWGSNDTPSVEISVFKQIIAGKPHDIGSFEVRRVLPYRRQRSVGPFVFLDEMGPATLAPFERMNVAPHPHINLATVTYLFDGEIVHRDSLGSKQSILPGAINWMTAGHGIVHSENSPTHNLDSVRLLHGLQLWLALPAEYEECEPEFLHYPAEQLPSLELEGAHIKVLIGTGFGARSPVKTYSPTFYIEARLDAHASLSLDSLLGERALYMIEGNVSVDGRELAPGTLTVFHDAAPVVLRASSSSRFMLLGGAALTEPRHMYWNFISTRKERIEQAKQDWSAGRFGAVFDDIDPPIPLPDEQTRATD